MCDRLSNVSNSENCDDKFKNKYIEETKYIFGYLSNERKLSKTHNLIIKTIIEKINSLEKNDNNIIGKTYSLF